MSQKDKETGKFDEVHPHDLPEDALNRKMFAERLRSLLGEESQRDFARKIGVSQGTLQHYLSANTEPSRTTLIRISQECGVSIGWLVTGVIDSREVGSHQSRVPHNSSNDFISVPRFSVQASAGHGAVAQDDGEPVSSMMFRRDWLKRIGVNLRACHVIAVKGQSMEPTLCEGDIVLVDASDKRPLPGALYALVIDDCAFIKRLQLQSDGSIILISDNKQLYRDELIPRDRVGDLHIIGRVRWFGRTL